MHNIAKTPKVWSFFEQFFAFSAQSSLLVASSTQPATTLQIFLIKNGGNVVKLPKIESGQLITKPNQQEKIEIRDKDIVILNLYSGQVFVAIIQHPSVGNSGTEIFDRVLQ